MKLKFRMYVSTKGLRRLIGLLIIVVPFFILLGAFKGEEIQKLFSRPYWERALGERAKQVPRFKEEDERETVEEIATGSLSDLPLYHLYIKANTLKELEELLPERKEHHPGPNILPESARIYKPADFEYRGRKWPVRIRFRGDMPIHWKAKKQSWRVKFPKDDLFNGSRRIDLINPKDANMLSDYMAMWLANRMGLLAPEIQLVNLKVNHRLMGVYQETEHIDKYFLENHGRPVGNIYGEEDKKPKWYGDYPLYTDVVFWRKHCARETQDPDDYTEMARLIQLLNDPSDEVFAEKIFDILDREKFYSWNCHALLCSSSHQDWFHNARLYFDPTSGLFEFIPWDLSGFWLRRNFFFDTPDKVHTLQYNPLSKRVLQHGPFRHERDCFLWSHVKDPAFLDEILAEADRMHGKIQTAVYEDSLKEDISKWPDRASYDNEQFEESFKGLKWVTRITFNRIREALQFNDLKTELELVRPDDTGSADKGAVVAKLGLVNSASSAVALRGIRLPLLPEEAPPGVASVSLELFEDENNNHRFDSSDRAVSRFEWDRENGAFSCGGLRALVYPELNEMLQPVSTRRDFFIVRTRGADAPPFDIGRAEIRAENAVTGEGIESRSMMVDEYIQGMDVPMPEDIAEFRALYPEVRCAILDGDRIVLEGGNHPISRTLVIPKGAVLEIPRGATLKFAPGCSLLCYGRLEARGRAGAPVLFTAEDPREGWGVIALCREGAGGSVLEHCTVEHGGEARLHGIYFTGALSAYYASVTVKNCTFMHNRGDDAVNLKNADGTLKSCFFGENAFDAVDYDYCEGIIADNHIANSGNDGIDCGTASPLIIGNMISNCGDKGISLGEESNPLICNNVIRNCTLGIASKDMSVPLIANNVLWNNETGISLYRKKFMFPGGGRALITNTILWGGRKTVLKDPISDFLATHCDSEVGLPGNGNVTVRPDFVDEAAGNYLVRHGSPLSRAGTDPGERTVELLGLTGDEFPIGLARPLSVPEREKTE